MSSSLQFTRPARAGGVDVTEVYDDNAGHYDPTLPLVCPGFSEYRPDIDSEDQMVDFMNAIVGRDE